MSKPTAIEKAISALEGEIAVLQAAIGKLKQQQTKAPARRPKPAIAEMQSA